VLNVSAGSIVIGMDRNVPTTIISDQNRSPTMATSLRNPAVPVPSSHLILPVLFLAILFVVTSSDARAAAPSLVPGMPPEIVSKREIMLESHEYAQLAEQWQAYIDEHPGSAVAHVMLARAQYYSLVVPVEKQHEHLVQARELNPDCPEALLAIADTGLYASRRLVADNNEAIELAERAVALAPDWPYPHFTLYSLYAIENQPEQAREQLIALADKNAFPKPLLDYAYNMLISAEPDAIVFTNGDNDTYPLLSLQAKYDIRPDVLVANLSLLNSLEYNHVLWEKAPRQLRPFSGRNIDALHEKFKRELSTTHEHLGTKIMRALCDEVADGSWRKPVYLAITLSQEPRRASGRRLELEGLLWRVKPEPADPEDELGFDTNRERTRQLFAEAFRYDSATDFSFAWPQHSCLISLMYNYGAVLTRVAFACAEAQEVDAMRHAFRKALTIWDFHGDRQSVASMAEYWQQLDPENPEIASWLKADR